VISFLVLLGILLSVILLGNTLRNPETQEKSTQKTPQNVEVYTLDQTPRFAVAGNIEDSGVITLQSQTSGIITDIRVSEGSEVSRGKTLVYISDTYLGGSSAYISQQIQERQETFQEENFNKRIDIPKIQGEELTPQTDDDLAKIQRNQYKIQEQNVLLDRDVAQLQTQQAQINTALNYPASPLTGTVEKIHIALGDLITQGTDIITLKGEGKITTTVLLPQRIASRIDTEGDHFTTINGEKITLTPLYLSRVSTNGQNYALVLEIPERFRESLTDNGFLDISLALQKDASPDSEEYLIPIDSVTLTTDSAFVFVEQNGKAQSKTITTEEVIGQYVIVKEGLSSEDRIILNRQVRDGDPVSVISE
jgi:RND family efflux transporter MFP subunit